MTVATGEKEARPRKSDCTGSRQANLRTSFGRSCVHVVPHLSPKNGKWVYGRL